MPVFHITAPDGTAYEVNGPEGSTEQQALAQVQAQHGKAPAPQASAPPTFGQKVGNMIGGVEQSLYDIPQSAIELGARATDAVGLSNGAYPAIHQHFQKAREFEGDPNSGFFNGGEIAGRVATTLPLMSLKVPGVANALPKLAPVINGAVQGSASAAATSASSDAPLGEQMGIGAGAGAALPALGLLARGGKDIAVNVLGATTGAGANSIRGAYAAGKAGGEAGDAFKTAMKDPSSWGAVVQDAKDALSNLRAQRSAAYKNGMVDVSKDATVLSFDPVDQSLAKTSGIKNFKGQDLSPKTAGVRQEVNDAISNWKSLDPAEYHTPEGFDALKQQLGDIRDSYKYGTPEWKVASDTYNAVRGTIADQAPAYNKVMGDYSKASDSIAELEKELSLGKKGNPNTALRKLQSVMRDNVNTSWGKRAELANSLTDAGATNLMPSLAGQALSSPLPRGLARWGDASLGTAVALGTHGAAALPMLAAASPRLVGNAAYAAGAASRGAAGLTSQIPMQLPRLNLSTALGATAPGMLAY